MTNDQPAVSRFEHTILIPVRLIDRGGRDAVMQDVAAALTERGPWSRTSATPASPPAAGGPNWPPLHALHGHQAYAYFHPFVRRFLFDPEMVIRCRRTDLRRVVIEPGQREPVPTLEFDVATCELWLFKDTGIAVLRLDLHAVPPLTGGTWPLHEVQRVIDQMRRLYPPYFDTIGDPQGQPRRHAGGHCPERVEFVFDDGRKLASDFGDVQRYLAERAGWVRPVAEHTGSFSWATHWEGLLLPFVTRPGSDPGERGWRVLQLGDDRAACMSFVGFSSRDALRSVDRGNWMRLCFGDAPGSDDLPYQRGFVADFEQRYCYDRYWYEQDESEDSPSRLMNCGFAFTWAGNNGDPYFFANETNGAPVIFRHLYVPMGIIAMFQHAALLAISARQTALPEPPDPQAQTALYRSFILFTQRYWFDDISPQVQGREIFCQWRRELGIAQLFEQVRLELRDMIDAQNADEQVEQSNEATRLTRLALPFAMLSLLVGVLSMAAGLLGMNSVGFDSAKPAEWCSVAGPHCIFSAPLTLSAILAMLAIVLMVVVAIWIVHWWRREGRARKDATSRSLP